MAVNLEVTVLDEDRRPIPGARVTFTLSPPGLPTSTYHAETDAFGVARWSQIGLPREGAIAGKGFATVFANLPGRPEKLQDTAPFTFE